MANYKSLGLFFFLSLLTVIAHLEIVYAIDFELCEQGDITLKNGSVFFNVSALKFEGRTVCRRLIHVDKGRVKLTINENDQTFFQENNVFQVFDGGFNSLRLEPKRTEVQMIYETTGNTMGILLKVEEIPKGSENFAFRGEFNSLPFHTTCKCSDEIQNGFERCWEAFGVKKCEVSCKKGFEDLTGTTGNFTCNLLNGNWDKDLESRGFECQSTVSPSAVINLNLTLGNSHLCSNNSLKENISTIVQDFFRGNENISAKGQCFGENKPNNCTVIDCVGKINSSIVFITIEDRAVAKSTTVKRQMVFSDLFLAYKTSSAGLKKELLSLINNITANNSALLNTVYSSVIPQCPTGMFLFNTTSAVGYPVCSKCPAGTFYKNSQCEKCPNGTSSLEGSESCSPKESFKITPPLKNSCEIYCMAGKGLNLKTGFCQWCPYNTFQNRTDMPNVNCSACPEGKKTPYPGATGIEQCYVPCQKGTFFSSNDTKCHLCPLGTYQDAVGHFYMQCKKCGEGKVTYTKGSEEPTQCVPSCTKGHYFDFKTSQCLECPLGSYQDKINQVNCTRCQVGHSTVNNGSSKNSDCVIMCLEGTYFIAQNGSCTECPKGTYMGQSGHLFPKCTKCAGNKTTLKESAVNETQCVDKCTNGEYFDLKTTSCIKCPLGTYMELTDHLLTSCKSCSGKKTTYKTGAVDEKQCMDECGAGEFFNFKNKSCDRCPLGTYMDVSGHLNTSCKSCSGKKTTYKTGAVDEKKCMDECGAGEFFNFKNNSCDRCPLGTYMDVSGHLNTSCKNCGPKKTTYKKGAVDDKQCLDECGAGEYFNSTMSSCKACPRGSFQMKSAQTNCTACPPGQSTRSTGETSELACVKFMCGPGEYLDENTGICHLCPKGTYQSAVNHTRLSCQQCASKTSSIHGATHPNSCTKICDNFPCENGAECIERADDYCRCPRGLTGKNCEEIEKEDELLKLEMSVRFMSLEWSEELRDKTSNRHRNVKYQIESCLRKVFVNDDSLVGVRVTELVKGSVIAHFDLYMNDNTSIVPAKALQNAVRNASVGGLPVDPSSLEIRQVTCDRALGMENGRIEDAQITASSESKDQEASRGRLNQAKGWRSKEVTSKNYLQVRFHSNVNITAIATQGDGVDSYVKVYTLSYSKDGGVWMDFRDTKSDTLAKNFTGNNDTTSIVKNILPEPITMAKYIRVIPVSWNNGIGMRIEVYGCISNPVLSPVTPAPTPTDKPQATTEPAVEAVVKKDNEYSWGKYLGITFGLLMVIGCLIAFFMWWRNSKKKKQQREKAPLVMTRIQKGEYKNIDKNADDYDEDAV